MAEGSHHEFQIWGTWEAQGAHDCLLPGGQACHDQIAQHATQHHEALVDGLKGLERVHQKRLASVLFSGGVQRGGGLVRLLAVEDDVGENLGSVVRLFLDQAGVHTVD